MSSGKEQQVYDDDVAEATLRLSAREMKVLAQMEVMKDMPRSADALTSAEMATSLINRVTEFINEWGLSRVPAVLALWEAPPPGADGESKEE